MIDCPFESLPRLWRERIDAALTQVDSLRAERDALRREVAVLRAVPARQHKGKRCKRCGDDHDGKYGKLCDVCAGDHDGFFALDGSSAWAPDPAVPSGLPR